MLCPGWTVSRLVPSAAISAFSPAADEEDSPSTATIAATPIAMPSADRPARSLRVRRPTTASRARSAIRSRAAVGAGRPGARAPEMVTVIEVLPLAGRASPPSAPGPHPARR